jgi:hypothetical protein
VLFFWVAGTISEGRFRYSLRNSTPSSVRNLQAEVAIGVWFSVRYPRQLPPSVVGHMTVKRKVAGANLVSDELLVCTLLTCSYRRVASWGVRTKGKILEKDNKLGGSQEGHAKEK